MAPHVERHFTAGEIVRDIVIGMSDGLTVPFALAAGLSGAAAPSSIVVTAGLAEVAAGSIAMGLGGWVHLLSHTHIHAHTQTLMKKWSYVVENIRERGGKWVSEVLRCMPCALH